MADDEAEEPAVTLGEGEPVEGAPLARIAERLMWGIEKSEIESREGESLIRTPDGPQMLTELLSDVDSTYFATRQEFESAVRDVSGTGPVPTAGETATDEPEPEEMESEETDSAETEPEAADTQAESELSGESNEEHADPSDADEHAESGEQQ